MDLPALPDSPVQALATTCPALALIRAGLHPPCFLETLGCNQPQTSGCSVFPQGRPILPTQPFLVSLALSISPRTRRGSGLGPATQPPATSLIHMCVSHTDIQAYTDAQTHMHTYMHTHTGHWHSALSNAQLTLPGPFLSS